MNWQELKSNIYFEDGSLRDIYILDTNRDDWKRWIQFVNSNYKVSLEIYEGDIVSDKIDFNTVLEFWNGKLDSGISATVFVGNIVVKSYFFVIEEIENDITPREVQSEFDHNELMNYMIGISKALSKKIILTSESTPEDILISVEHGNITLLSNGK